MDRTSTRLDTRWTAVKAAEALRYLGRHYPEGLTSTALHEHEEAANRAALEGDSEAYIEALRDYCRAGRAEALGKREAA